MATVAELTSSLLVDIWELDAAEVQTEASFADDLGLDSLDVVALLAYMEEELGLDELPAMEMADVATVGQLVEHLEDALRQAAAPPPPSGSPA